MPEEINRKAAAAVVVLVYFVLAGLACFASIAWRLV